MSCVVRPLREGEESSWVALVATTGGDDAERRCAQLRAQRGQEAPECFLVAAQGERIVGRLKAFRPDAQTYVVASIVASESAITHALFAYAAEVAGPRIEAVSWKRSDQLGWHDVLLREGFAVHMEKAYVRRKLGEARSTYDDAFVYRSLAEMGEDAFVEALRMAYTDTIDRAIEGDAVTEFASCRAFAGNAFDPVQWHVAHTAEGPCVGVVCPQIYPDVRHEGSIFAFGVVPRFRGRGWAKVLHAHGLDVLTHAGATDYVGSTDVRNAAMLRVFAANECRETGVRRFYRRVEPPFYSVRR